GGRDGLIHTTGGGITGQAGACSQGVARAIKTMFGPPDEQKRHVFNATTLVKAYRDEKKAREKAKAPTPPPAPRVAPAAPKGPPLIPTAAKPGQPAPSTDGTPVETAD